MPEFSVYTLASSSKGNSVYIKCGVDEILIDAGISTKRLELALESLDTSLSQISAVFITHEHSDHIAALPVMSKKYGIPIHITEPSAREILSDAKYAYASAHTQIHPPEFSVNVGSLTVRAFATPHDSAGSVGYVITDGSDEHTVALATDIGCITGNIEANLLGIQNVIIESNHDENMLLNGPYSYDLKRRILSDRGHLSNENCAKFVKKLAASGTKHILLAHLSPENNIPELALETAKNAIADFDDVSLSVADMKCVTRLV